SEPSVHLFAIVLPTPVTEKFELILIRFCIMLAGRWQKVIDMSVKTRHKRESEPSAGDMKLAQFFQDGKLRLEQVRKQELFPLNFEGDFHA
ncbi:MAG: hypothetical protein J7J71_08175, partial [Deltaproteobacteria bacterium]|nr:hypothetical protein [Candidatus Tharpella sp.]